MWEAMMEKQRFIEAGNQSFFGEYLYDQVVPADHFHLSTPSNASATRIAIMQPELFLPLAGSILFNENE